MKEEHLFQILYLALVDIRERARGVDEKIFRIADAVHNAPGILELYHKGEISSQEATQRITAAFETRGMLAWLAHHLENNLE
jgi:hypothetical protein